MTAPLRTLQKFVVALFVAALCQYPRPADGARVLAFNGVAGKSHWNFMKGVLLAMVDGGHRVTVYTPFPDRGAGTVAVVNYTEVDTFAEYPVHLTPVAMNATQVVPLFADPSFLFPFMANGSRLMCDIADRVLADRRGDEFDAFVTEPLSSECVSHAARRLGVPLIYAVPSPVPSWLEASVFGHPANPAYVPHLFSAHSADVGRTFYRRLSNAALYLRVAYLHYRTTRAAAALDGRYYDRVPPVKPALVFVNTHHVTDPGRPVPANRIDVGGIHLVGAEPLPADILEFIEDSPNGVILLTFGSVVALSTLPDEIQKAFKDAIAEVPQRVLMKYESKMHNKPKNVMTSKWLPQRDILLHPNVKLFIGHGGISGVYEAVDAGVPVLGFPLFYDQPRNLANLVSAGMAISLDLFSVTKDDLLKSINELVNNETYSQNAKKVSRIFKDRPISPAQSVIYWTDYVIRHNGASHLKSQALNLSWYQYFLLDMIALVLFGFVFAIYITYRLLKLLKLCIFKLSTRLLKSKSE